MIMRVIRRWTSVQSGQGPTSPAESQSRSLGRRKFALSLIILGAWALLRQIFGGRPASASSHRMVPGGTFRAPGNAVGPFRVKAKSFEVTGGSKPGDTVTLKLTIEHSGGSGSVSVPWKIYRDNDVVVAQGTKQVTAGATATFDVTANWTATAGAHDFYGEVDPSNTLNEPSGERRNNITGSTARVFSDWARWLQAARDGTKEAHSSWRVGAMFAGIAINGPTATGGRLEGPSLAGPISAKMAGVGAPSQVAEGLAGAVAETFKAWTDTIRVPALPWYPAFAAFPGANAPPTPNVPTPMSSLAHDPARLDAGALASKIRGRVGSAKEWPGAGGIDDYARWFSAGIIGWLPRAQVLNVLGKGPVPSFAPPYVPVGPVVGGTNVATPGHLASVGSPWP